MQASLITAGTVRGTLGSMYLKYLRHHINKTTINPLRTAGSPSGRSAKLDYDAYWGRGGLERPDLVPSIVIGSEVLAWCVPLPGASREKGTKSGTGLLAEVFPWSSIGHGFALDTLPLLTARARDRLWFTSKHMGCWCVWSVTWALLSMVPGFGTISYAALH